MTTTTANDQLEGLGTYKFGWADTDVAGASAKRGLSEEVVRDISARKNEPEWMLENRLKGLKYFGRKPMPAWGSDLSGIDFDNIKYFVRSTEKQAETWDDLPAYIKNTYDRLGIPEAEKQRLIAGVAAQYESEVVYHKIREDLEEKGVIFLDTDSALKQHPELFKEYYGTVIPAGDNKFAALNTSVWSGGSFIYVPPGGRDHGVDRRQHRLQGHDEVPGGLPDGRARQGRDPLGRVRGPGPAPGRGGEDGALRAEHVLHDRLQVGRPRRRPDVLPGPDQRAGGGDPLQVDGQVRRAAGRHDQPVRHLPVQRHPRGRR